MVAAVTPLVVRALFSTHTQLVRASVAAGSIALIFAGGAAHAQDLEPRAYSNTPVGLNFLIAGYSYSEGKIAFDPTLPIANAQYYNNTEVIAYARSLDAWGHSAKFDMILPYSQFSGHALVDGQHNERDVSGLNDPRFRFSLNFYGAPALTLKEFAGYRQDLIVGASLSVTAPARSIRRHEVDQPRHQPLVVQARAGHIQVVGKLTVDILPSVTFYTDNADFYYGRTYAQAPLYAVQGHVIYGFASGIWMALDATYFTGNRTTVDGVGAITCRRTRAAA